MTHEHERLRQLVLCLEDLDGDERQQAEAHLAGCVDCARLRARVLAVEARVRMVPALPDASDPLVGFGDDERAQARASRERLLAGQRNDFRRKLRRIMPLALAAVAATAVLAPLAARRPILRDVQIGSPLVLRGGTPPAADFGLGFRMARAGYPVLLHVDAAGRVRLLYPALNDPAARFVRDQLVLLPPPDDGDAWRANVPTGCETYLLAAALVPPGPQALFDLASLPPAPTRAEAVRAASRRLADLVGKVVRRDAEGCP